MPRRDLAKPPAEPVVKPYGCDCPQQTSFFVHFLFSAACELWRRSPGSIYPGWISGALRTAFQIPVTVNLCFQRPVQRQDRPAEPLAADGGCNHLRTDAGVAIIQRKAVSTVTVAALSADQTVGPLPLCRVHAVGGAVRPVFQWRQMLIGLFFRALPPLFFLLPFSPKRLPAPFLRRVPALARSLWSRCPEAGLRRTSPTRVFLFRRSFGFQGACPSMNYLKCILF